MSIETERELATHGVKIEHLANRQDEMVADLDEIKKAVHDIQNTLSEAKGGWRMLLLIGGAGGVVGAFLLDLFQSLGGK